MYVSIWFDTITLLCKVRILKLLVLKLFVCQLLVWRLLKRVVETLGRLITTLHA